MKRIIGRKAEWLKGDGVAYINTLAGFSGIEIESKFRVDTLSRLEYKGVVGFLKYSNGHFLDGGIAVVADFRKDKRLWSLSVVGDDTQNGTSFDIGVPYVFKYKNNCYYLDEDVIDSKNSNIDNSVIPIFARIIYPNNISASRSSFAYFNIVGKLSLTPLVLTSPLPGYLSSDNLPHAAGECGMWDSVSEKFYGNANTSGAFSVENELDEYVEVDLTGIAINGKYQRVTVENSEIPSIVWNGVNARMLMLNGKVVWNDGILIGERYQYLAFKANLTSTDICEIPTIIDWPKYFRLQIKHSWNQQQYVTLWQAGNFRLHKPSSNYALYYPNGSYTGQFSISGQLDFDCVINNEDGTCEGHVGSKQLNIAKFGSVSGRLRLMLKSSNWRNSGQVGECILTDLDTNEVKHHFIPCVLSVDIDENLSLLNTPHQQGTIGMWDIVTKKFTTNSKGFDVLEARNKQGFITK